MFIIFFVFIFLVVFFFLCPPPNASSRGAAVHTSVQINVNPSDCIHGHLCLQLCRVPVNQTPRTCRLMTSFSAHSLFSLKSALVPWVLRPELPFPCRSRWINESLELEGIRLDAASYTRAKGHKQPRFSLHVEEVWDKSFSSYLGNLNRDTC